MKIENVNGRNLVCGHIFDISEIQAGQIWAPASGGDWVVTVTQVDVPLKEVHYSWTEQNGDVKHHSKECFSFQCRYCKVIKL